METYIKPQSTVVELQGETILAGSGYQENIPDNKKCNSLCDIYHVCRDRDYRKYCSDKRYRKS